jgi:putrescine aminotransferase
MGHLDVMSPPLVLTRDEADFLVDTLRGAISDVTDELVREGVV